MTPDETYSRYRRIAVAEMADWHPDFDMSGVSISEADREAGSPKPGDKIARNPKNHSDRWLVSEEYFADNFEEADDAAVEWVDPIAELREIIHHLRAENARLREALEEIAAKGCGIPGHSVAVGCGANAIARRALEADDGE